MRSSIEKWCSVFNRRIRTEINRRCSPYGLNEANFFYLIIVDEDPGISQNRMIEIIQRDQSIVTRHINHLVDAGWLEKRTAASDRRKSELFLTDKGREIIPVLDRMMDDISEESVAGLTRDEAATLERLLKKAAETYK